MVEIIVGIIGVVTGSAAVYFQVKDPSRRNSSACKSLANLLVALRSIGNTGREIGVALHSQDGIMDDKQARRHAFENLIQMLEVQNDNIRNAQSALSDVENILKIQAPALSDLHFHLRGKNHRIDILYDAATIGKLKEDPRSGVEHWEVSKLQGEQDTMLNILDEAMSSNVIENITIGENIREKDDNFQLILDAIEPLDTLIKESCTPGDLL